MNYFSLKNNFKYNLIFNRQHSELFYFESHFLGNNKLNILKTNVFENKYKFLKITLGVYNNSFETKLKKKIFLNVIERSVNFISIVGLNSFLNNSLKLGFVGFFNSINQGVNLKELYIKTVLLQINKFIKNLLKFELNNLNFFSRKKISDFYSLINKKYLMFDKNFFLDFGFFFNLFFQKINYSFIISNYFNFFFLSFKKI
jgi:hypothetical protein